MPSHFAELFIEFYNNSNDASVVISKYNENQLYLDILFLCHFTIRQMSNLGGMPQIVAALSNVENSVLKEFDIGDYINARDVQLSMPRIISSKWGSKKFFKAMLSIIGTQENQIFAIEVNPKNFGLLGRDISYYSVQSINVLIRFLALRYRNDEFATKRIKQAVYILSLACAEQNLLAPGNIVQQSMVATTTTNIVIDDRFVN